MWGISSFKKNLHQRICFYWFKGERDINVREKHGSAASCLCQWSNWQPRHMPWLGIEPTTFWYMGQCHSQLTHLAKKRSFFFFFKTLFIYFLEKGRESEREGEKHQCVVASHMPPYWGPGPQTRNVPWLGIKLATLWFTGRHSTTEPHKPGLKGVSLHLLSVENKQIFLTLNQNAWEIWRYFWRDRKYVFKLGLFQNIKDVLSVFYL